MNCCIGKATNSTEERTITCLSFVIEAEIEEDVKLMFFEQSGDKKNKIFWCAETNPPPWLHTHAPAQLRPGSAADSVVPPLESLSGQVPFFERPCLEHPCD